MPTIPHICTSSQSVLPVTLLFLFLLLLKLSVTLLFLLPLNLPVTLLLALPLNIPVSLTVTPLTPVPRIGPTAACRGLLRSWP